MTDHDMSMCTCDKYEAMKERVQRQEVTVKAFRVRAEKAEGENVRLKKKISDLKVAMLRYENIIDWIIARSD